MIKRLTRWLGRLSPWDADAHGNDTIARSIQAEEAADAVQRHALFQAHRMEQETGHFWRDFIRGVEKP